MLSAASLLDRDLGLGSLERVELLARLETEFGVRLPDRVAAEANTPEDLTRAILGAPGADASRRRSALGAARFVTAQKLSPRRRRKPESFRRKHCSTCCAIAPKHDADRAHLLITEETPTARNATSR